MIFVNSPIAEPTDFDTCCRKAGAKWLLDNPDAKRPSALWSKFHDDLAEGFANRCGYGAMWISKGTVDHFVSWNEDKSLAYEWSNYRFLDGWINSSKNKKASASLLDPFDVQEGWFEILLPSLQLVMTDEVPEPLRALVKSTLENLPISHDERLVRNRREWLRMYEEGELNLEGLRKKAPLIATAVEKRDAQQAREQEPDQALLRE